MKSSQKTQDSEKAQKRLYPKERSLAPEKLKTAKKKSINQTPTKTSPAISEERTSKKQLIEKYIELSSKIKVITQENTACEQEIHKLEEDIQALEIQIQKKVKVH